MYGGYSAAASNFHRMQENNPDWVEAITGHDTANTPDQSISVLLDKMKEIVMVYSERRKFLDMQPKRNAISVPIFSLLFMKFRKS